MHLTIRDEEPKKGSENVWTEKRVRARARLVVGMCARICVCAEEGGHQDRIVRTRHRYTHCHL